MHKINHILLAAIFVLLLAVPVLLFGATETSHTERSFPATSGGTVTVDSSFHEVEVTARPGSTVDIVVDLEISASAKKAKRLLADYEPRFEVDGGDIVVRSIRDGSNWNWGTNRTEGSITVAMPPDMDLVVDNSSGPVVLTGDFGNADVSVDASSGRVKGSAAMATLSVDNSSGGTDFEALRPLEKFTVDCSSGSVHLKGGAIDARVDSSSGSVRLSGLQGDADVDASSGAVELKWTTIAPSAKVRVDTSSGGVHLMFPPGTDLDGEVDTSSGGIRSDFPFHSKDSDHAEFKGGADAVRLTVDTSSGGVRISETN